MANGTQQVSLYTDNPPYYSKGTNFNPAIIADPLEGVKSVLQSFGMYDALTQKFLSSDYPIGSEEEYLRHYLFGIGKPFINFLVFVDVGVGYFVEADFGDQDLNKEISTMCMEMLERIEYQTTLTQVATYSEVLGRSCMVETVNLAQDDYYTNPLEDIHGIDSINPMSLDYDSIKDALNDKTNKTPFKQVWNDMTTGEHEEVELEAERVTYITKNPFTTLSVEGVSTFANAINDLRVGARFARYKAQVADKASRLHRHFKVDTEKFMKLKPGKEILNSKEKSKNYLYSVHQMINTMNERGSDVATMDYLDSKEVTWAGKIPNITDLERGVFESVAFKLEIPINTMTYGKDVNRNTLEVLSDIFIRRRETGAQNEYIKHSNKFLRNYLEMKDITEKGTVRLKFNKFLPEDITQLYLIISDFAAKLPGVFSDTEIRRKLQMPDKIEYGDADTQKQEKIEEMMRKQAQIQAETTGPTTLQQKLDQILYDLEQEHKQ